MKIFISEVASVDRSGPEKLNTNGHDLAEDEGSNFNITAVFMAQVNLPHMEALKSTNVGRSKVHIGGEDLLDGTF